MFVFFFFQAEDGIRDSSVTGVQTCALPIFWAATGAAIAACILLRPDGGILLAAVALYLAVAAWRCLRVQKKMADVLVAAIIVAAIALAPLAPWTIRNFRALHHFQPLAPRYANEPD